MGDAGGRTWRWFKVRLSGLFNRNPVWRTDGQPISSTRIGLAMNPPPPPAQQ